MIFRQNCVFIFETTPSEHPKVSYVLLHILTLQFVLTPGPNRYDAHPSHYLEEEENIEMLDASIYPCTN